MKRIKTALLKIFSQLFSFFISRPEKPTKLEKIAIFSTTGLGDTLWAMPAIKALKASFPECRITALLSPIGKEVLLNNPFIDEVIVHSLFPFHKLYMMLRRKKFDAIVIFHASERKIFLLAKLLNPHYIIGTLGRSKDSDFILTNAIKPHFNEHEIQRRVNLIYPLGAQSTNDLKLQVFLTDDEREQANFFLKSMGVEPQDKLIGIHPGSKDIFKRWPKEYFINVAKKLQNRIGCKVIITGSMHESKLAKSIAKELPYSISLFGQVSLRTMIAIIEKMSLYITNDTGPMHIAFAMDIPTISLFSPTHPSSCGPLQASNSIVEYVNRCCVPCLAKKCKDPFCMRQISQETVLKHALSILQTEEKLINFKKN